MFCKKTCELCKNLIISNAVNFDAATNALIIDLPAREYKDGCKYCIIVAQTIPQTTTISALVYITVGGSAVRYPLTKCNCAQVTACGLRSETKYSTIVDTNTTGGVFRLLGNTCCEPDNTLQGLTGIEPVA